MNASMRGKAIRREPIISGTTQLANGPRMPEVIIPIIIVPCMPTSVRYWLAPNTWRVRLQQLGADQHRVQAADEEEHPDPDQVLHGHDLVVGGQSAKYRESPSSSLSFSASVGGWPSIRLIG